MRANRFLLIPLLLAPLPAAAQTEPALIRVSATGETKVRPDEAWVDLGVETQAPTARAAAEANAAAMQRVIDALVRAGVPRAEIETQGYSVNPDYEADPEGREPQLRGYRVSNVVSAHTGRIDGVGALLDAGLGAGANRVNGVRFGVRDTEAARARALQEAVRRARAEAQTIAAALGVARVHGAGGQHRVRARSADADGVRPDAGCRRRADADQRGRSDRRCDRDDRVSHRGLKTEDGRRKTEESVDGRGG